MDTITLDITDLEPTAVAALLELRDELRAGITKTARAFTPAPYQVEGWGHVGHEGTEEQEQAYDIITKVIAHGTTRGLDWAPLVLALVKRNGEQLERDNARSLVTDDPQLALNALRGLKQAFERAAAQSTAWANTEIYQPRYVSDFKGLASLGLDKDFTTAALAVLHIEQ